MITPQNNDKYKEEEDVGVGVDYDRDMDDASTIPPCTHEVIVIQDKATDRKMEEEEEDKERIVDIII